MPGLQVWGDGRPGQPAGGPGVNPGAERKRSSWGEARSDDQDNNRLKDDDKDDIGGRWDDHGSPR